MPDEPLLEEYKLLLGKIDKIGDYRFLVRGWSATIVLGLLLGSSAANVPAYIVLLAVPIVVLFYLMESNQNHLQIILMKRATSLERAFQSASTKTYADPSPYAKPLGPVPGIATVINQFGRRESTFQKAARWSNFGFYLIQMLLILLVFGLHLASGTQTSVPGNVTYFNTTAPPSAVGGEARVQVTPKASEKTSHEPNEKIRSEVGEPRKGKGKAPEAKERH